MLKWRGRELEKQKKEKEIPKRSGRDGERGGK